jgi:fatty aldehyde-generating acyl-ACP reductase
MSTIETVAAGDLPGSSLSDFSQLVASLNAIVDDVGPETFRSVYTLIALATQLAELDNPLFGSGRSPFSMISLLPKFRRPEVAVWAVGQTLRERRILIDEIYDMAAPILLGEAQVYADLMTETVYREALGAHAEAFRSATREKAEMLAPLVRRLQSNAPGQAVHIAHYGYANDLQREHVFVKHLPPDLFTAWCQRSFPTVFEVNFRQLSREVDDVRVWIVVINNSTEQLLTDPRLRRAKILQAASLADRLGARVIGMGGLVASFATGGQFLTQLFPQIGFTTGHAMTIANILEIAKAAAERVRMAWESSTIAIVGAGGSIGSGCARLVAELKPRRLYLIDVPGQPALAETAAQVQQISGRIQVICSHNLKDVRHADLSIVATNWPGSLLEPGDLKPGAIVIDDSYPKNVSEAVGRERQDVIALEGGILKLPAEVEIDRSRNVPNLLDVPLTRMISCREVYGCFAETLTLAALNHVGNYGLGRSDPALAHEILGRSKDLGFRMAPLQFFGEAISERRFRMASAARPESGGAQS